MSFAELVPGSITITIQGKTLRARMVGMLACHAEAARQLTLTWGTRLQPLLDILTEDKREDLLQRAYDDTKVGVTMQDTNRWIYTPDGLIHMFWMAVKDEQPDMDLKACTNLLNSCTAEDFNALRLVVEHAQGFAVNPSEAGESLPENGQTTPITTATVPSIGV